MAGKGRVAERGRVAAPLLGGVRGWVYFYVTTYRGITTRKQYFVPDFAPILPGDECFLAPNLVLIVA